MGQHSALQVCVEEWPGAPERDPAARAFDCLPTACLVFEGHELAGCNRAARRLLGLGAAADPRQGLGVLLAGSGVLDILDQRILAAAMRALLQAGEAEACVECGRQVFRLAALEMEGGRVVTIAHEAAGPALRRLGGTDALTGLLDRVAFDQALREAEDAASSAYPAALLFLDLDRFKHVNDTLGHPVGDALLSRAAERMRKAVRSENRVGRLGGDEFAVLMQGADAEIVAGVARRLIDLVSRPYLIDGHLVTIGISIGAALMPEDAARADQLARCADLALYRAKAEGRGVLRSYRPEMAEQAAARRQMEFDLRKALLLGEFQLDYQPQMAVDGTGLVGFEALLRWAHPTRGRISPAEFIPLAEENGLILAIGEWVLRTAAAEATRWPEELTLAVNLSPVQFRTGDLVATVASVLAATGLAPGRLELEITEGVLLSDEGANLGILANLRRLGVKVAIDDFGTGYASLASLRHFAFDKIKIDRSFVSEMLGSAQCDAIVRAVVELGAELGMATIAEGVETPEELSRIRSHGCDAVQGFLTGRPMDLHQVRDLIADQAEASRHRA